MSQRITLCLALHNHQPVGNFEFVIEQAFEDSYLPFLNVFEEYTDLTISLHTSGPLLEWIEDNRPDYLERLRGLVKNGRVEIVGGAFYEPILTMIPQHDRIGQITRFSQMLESKFETPIRGMWVPERVWEQSLASDLVDAGIRYTILDDFHFRNAGLSPDQLHGYYLTEDEGRTLAVFPGSERLRYLIPFSSPQETVDYLGQIHAEHPEAVLLFGDDGEKFGTWPDTKQHVYDYGWLRQFFELLSSNSHWIKTTTLSEALSESSPKGKIYIPEGSYREMTEWALPTDRQVEFHDLSHDLEHDPRWERIRSFVRGGYWRNFKAKYSESDEMYSRMMQVSHRLQDARQHGADGDLLDQAQRELFRGQCNCGYWHGAFGGIYLPHLRNAIFNHLIAAENLVDRAIGNVGSTVDHEIADFNFNLLQEVRLFNQKLIAYISPNHGGEIYELDVRSICHNLLATMRRRPEVYHRTVASGGTAQNGDVSSIHDRVVFKQEGLDQCLQYDDHGRKSLIDHFFADDVTLEDVASGTARELGDFVGAPFEAKVRSNPDRRQIVLRREGNVEGAPIVITKGVALNSDSDTLELSYLLENIPHDKQLHFGVELNFAGLPAGADDRYFSGANNQRLGQLGNRLDLVDVDELGLTDEWLGIDAHIHVDRATSFWTFPIATVSQSEGGFELVHQSVVVIPHWYVTGDVNGKWSATFRLALDTSRAEARERQTEAVLA